MFKSATFKLTMWYLALVMAISLVFSAVVYRVGSNELAHGLHGQTERIYTNFPVFDNSPLLRPGKELTSGEHRLLAQLVFFNILVFAGAGFASYWLARRTLEPIEAAHEQQKRFTADVSHELRTPLTALKMGSEVALMDTGASKAELRQALASNIEEANKLDSLINSLLRLTRLDADEVRQSFAPLNTTAVTSEALQHVQHSADAKHIELINETKNISISGDKDSLVQLLVILLDNAIKYSPDGSSITFSSKTSGQVATMSVKDQGVGIEPAALERVFDRFYRADASRSRGGSDGFGLGLSIAKMIADLHNGTITLNSRVGSGTTATLTLPTHTDK
ncbi:MAG TPA: HAMP domain-containing sensor histidine kinase [Patescibacteria group bacterium]|nr:HAMP domain-containing sensor histidine kinase [Patescibacteria group bacterium]